MFLDSPPCPEQLPKLALHAQLSLDNERLSVDLGHRLAVGELLAHLGKFEDLNGIIQPRHTRDVTENILLSFRFMLRISVSRITWLFSRSAHS